MNDSPRPYFSIIIATFNSARLLPRTLDALRAQDFPADQIEVLMIDGGSTDDTLALGAEFGARLIENPRTEPVYAKWLGLEQARGRYAVYLDHDEVFADRSALAKRRRLFESHPDLRAVVGSGYRNPEGYPVINRYINDYGDPFSFFMYRLSKDASTFVDDMKARYRITAESEDGLIVDFGGVTSLPILELCAASGTIDVDFFRRDLDRRGEGASAIPHLFYLMLGQTQKLGITKDDVLFHYSSDTWAKYRQKLEWRIKNNIYHAKTMGQAGFAGRQNFGPAHTQLLKLLFIPYGLSVIGPLVDAALMIYKKRDLLYLAHVPLAFFVAALIIVHSILNLLGVRPKLRSYDGSKVIDA